jgi:cytochrome c553
MKKLLLLIATSAILLAQTPNEALQFGADGQPTLPNDYRQWIYLSTGMDMSYGPAAQANPESSKFDNVFVNPASYRAFVNTGHWPDKTTFVLEVRAAASHGSINQSGHYQNELLGIDVETRDDKRFPQKWAFFTFDAGKDKGSAQPATSSCNTCHKQNGAVDNTFVQFYPTLAEIAKAKGTFTAGK